jgi:hypothetical protein
LEIAWRLKDSTLWLTLNNILKNKHIVGINQKILYNKDKRRCLWRMKYIKQVGYGPNERREVFEIKECLWNGK